MKRYMAFYGDVHYPSGGMDDFIGDFDQEWKAKEAILKKRPSNSPEDFWTDHWGAVYDTGQRKEVWTI